MTAIDPYRTLGLAPGATQAEIKMAYRRLAKLNHPDSAGERALPRFLAIQAAYEALIADPNGQRRPGRGRSSARPAGPPAPPWQADASRARATREAYRARNRGAPGASDPGSTGPRSGPGPGGSPSGRPGAPRADERGSTRGPAPDDAGAADGGTRSRRSSRRPKATIGSTSYDGADKEPFDPAWEGATWYGAGSGTYWTLNPKEYADPRKHGPEYQARSKRGIGYRPGDPADQGDQASEVSDAADGFQPTDAPDGKDRPDPTDNAGAASGRQAARSAVPPGDDLAARAARHPRMPPAPAPGPSSLDDRPWPGPARARRPPPPPRPPVDTAARASVARSFEPPSTVGRRAAATLPERIGWAVLGWIPMAIGLAALSDGLPACSGVAMICSDPLTAGVWLVDLLVLGLLIGIPRLSWVAAVGSLAFFIVGLLATPVLLVLGGARTTSGTAAALTVVLIVAWLGGVILAAVGRAGRPPWQGPRVG
jgi:curved DNA-binding protein CbpA